MTVLSLPDLRILGSSPARGSLRVYSVRIGYSGREAAQLFAAYRENQLRGDNYLDIHRDCQLSACIEVSSRFRVLIHAFNPAGHNPFDFGLTGVIRRRIPVLAGQASPLARVILEQVAETHLSLVQLEQQIGRVVLASSGDVGPPAPVH